VYSLSAHRIFAWSLLLAIIGICAVIAVQPLVDAGVMRRELERSRLSMAEPGSLDPGATRFDPADVFLMSDEAAAVLRLQGWLEADAQAAGLSLGFLRVVGQASLGEHDAVWVEIAGEGDLQSVTELLEALERRRPAILVSEIDLSAADGAEPDHALDLRMVAGVLFREGGEGVP
jgi:hypothetical protein